MKNYLSYTCSKKRHASCEIIIENAGFVANIQSATPSRTPPPLQVPHLRVAFLFPLSMQVHSLASWGAAQVEAYSTTLSKVSTLAWRASSSGRTRL
jgi:hypothetical protein